MHNAKHFLWLLFGFGIHLSLMIPIDNGVEGDPEVECGANDVVVNFNTQNPFEGHVYVKGSFNERTCRSSDNGRRVAGITIPFDRCNVMRSRSLNPRGIFVTTTVVITFHPNFITKIDRAYTIRCFYMEADKTLSLGITVSDMTTVIHTHAVAMPVCKYEILARGPDGEAVSYAMIGQQVYHKWTCVTESIQVFCMVVHSCKVDDGNGDIVTILDANGCALDKYILNNLEYPGDLSAGQEAHVYKYADRSQLFYQCQITITTKDRNETCPRPQCPEPIGLGAGSGGGPLQPKEAVGTGVNTVPGTGIVSFANSSSAGAEDLVANFSVPATVGLNVSANSGLSARFKDFLRRSKKDIVDWKKHSIGTVDVRAEMNALDVIQRDVIGDAVVDEKNDVVIDERKSESKSTSIHATCYYSTILLASLTALCSCFLAISTVFTIHSLYINCYKGNSKLSPNY